MEENNLEAILGADTCRLCLKVGRSPTPVSNEKLEGSTMAIKIDILTSVKVAPSDKVCPMCRINVRNFYDFRIMCLQSDARIKSWLARGEQSSVISFPHRTLEQTLRIYKRRKGPTPRYLQSGRLAVFGKKDGQSELNTAKERRLNQMVCVRPVSKKAGETGNSLNCLENDPITEREVRPDSIVDTVLEMDSEADEGQSKDMGQDEESGGIEEEISVPEIKREIIDFDTPEVESNENRYILDTKDVKSEILNEDELFGDEPKAGPKEDQTKGDRPKDDSEPNTLDLQIVKTETLVNTSYEEEMDETEAVFCKEPDFQEVKEEPVDFDDTENLEVLVDPLMVVDEQGDENQAKRNALTLSPVLGENGEPNKRNGHVLFPALNGALSDEQRALDFVRKHLRKDRTPCLPEPVSPPPQPMDPLDKPFKCMSCTGSFAYYKSFVKHRNRHTGFDTPYECPHCVESFATNKEMHVHFRMHAETQFCCDQCYRSFPSKERLNAHNHLHLGNKPHTCELCKKSFPYRSSFAIHMRKAHDEEIPTGSYFRCHKCPTEWSSTSNLKEHILEIHEFEETDAGSTCEVCAMKFLSKAILNVHSRIHQGIRPFSLHSVV